MGKVANTMGYFAGFFNIIGIPLIVALIIPKLTLSKRIFVFFAVFITIWILSLNVNPYNLQDNNKYAILRHLPSEYLPKMRLIRSMDDIHYIYSTFQFPIIIKPTVCDGSGRRIVRLESINQLFNWAEKNRGVFGSSPRLDQQYMVQEVIKGEVELGILVEKMPYEKYVSIVSIVEKTGNSPIRKGCEDIHCVRRDDLVPILQPALRKISAQIPNFNVGRYDIRSTEQDLRKGRFQICEINGLYGFDLRCWTADSILYTFYLHERWFISRVIIGLTNILMLRGYSPANLLRVMWITFNNTIECRDHEKFHALYS